LQDQLVALRQDADLLTLRALAETANANPWQLQACAWDEQARADAEAVYRGKTFTQRQVAALREDASLAPFGPGADVKLAIRQQVVHQGQHPHVPAWVRNVADQRDYFVLHCLIVLPESGGEGVAEFYEFMYAYQSPKALCLAKLRRKPAVCCGPGVPLRSAMAQSWDYDFVSANEYVYSASSVLCSWPEERLQVLPDLVHLQPSSRVVSQASPIALCDFLADLPPVKATSAPHAPTARRGDVSARARLLAENPWAMAYVDEAARVLKRHKGDPAEDADVKDDDVEAPDEEEDPLELDEEAAQEVFAAMEAARADAQRDDMGLFRVLPLGGAWTAIHRGVAQDAWQGKASGAEAVQFAERYLLQQRARFDISLYTYPGALACARYWATKMAFFHALWVGGGGKAPFVFPDEELATFQEPAEFTKLTQECTAHRAQTRFTAFRAMRPAGNGELLA